MRSSIEANEYKDYILGFIFYKYLSEKEENWLLRRDYTPDDIREYVNEDDPETVQSAQQSLGYFIAYKDLFSTWIGMGADFSVDNVRTALSSFSRLISESHKKVFEGIFNTLETGLSKLGRDNRTQTKAVQDLIHLINDIPMENYDVLGYVYEYLIEKFASNAGKKAGEFYTPHEVSVLMSEIVADHLKDRSEIRIYDPTSGSGSLLLNIGHAIAKYMDDPNRIRYYAQELKANTYNLTRMNLVMRGILPDNIVTRNGDTLEEDWPYFDETDPAATYEPLYVDAVVSNPPYSQPWDPSGKENDPRFARFGLAPKSKADYAFLLHELFHLKPDGIMTIVLPHGVLFRGGEEGQIRKNLIEQNNIDAIIGLPANIFYGTGIPTIIMVLRQKRENTDILIVDASKGFEKVGKSNKLRACDIRKIVDTVTGRLDIDKYSRKISREEIRQNDYNLNIPRYVDSSEEAETWDLYASMYGGIPETELSRMQDYWQNFPSLKGELFDTDRNYANLKTSDIRQTIMENEDVKDFISRYRSVFADFGRELEEKLIDQAETVSAVKEKDQITGGLFRRFSDIPLVDKYAAYELFSDGYTEISGDLELIQAEGMECVKQVDPNMVLKKKNGRDQEVQDGWKGHVLPFELVQKTLLQEDLKAIQEKEDRLQEIPSEYTSLIDEMSEDDKEAASDALNDDNDAFVMKNVKRVVKELKQDGSGDALALAGVLTKAEALSKEEKGLKSDVKKETEALHLKTKDVIESLDDDQVRTLLQKKWIRPICEGIDALPETLLSDFAKQVQALADKYADTLEDIENEIQETEKSLSSMLSELTGDEFDMAGIRQLQKMLGGEE
jgi:type I restriction enzyme M protein